MSFITPAPNHWSPDDFELSSVRLPEPLLHVTKAICLLESRCDDYANYLQAIFRDRTEAWTSAISQWNEEECQHGIALRAVCEAGDQGFDFGSSMATYKSMVAYHAPTGETVRGSVLAELVSRCVVEALASTLYRVLADSTTDQEARALYAALAQDEARHFGMFDRMLRAEAEQNPGIGVPGRCRFAMQRVLEIEDAQIMLASCVAGGRTDGNRCIRREAHRYLAILYPLYRWSHVRYAVRMLLRTVNLRPLPVLVDSVTAAMWLAIKLRLLLARLALLADSVPAQVSSMCGAGSRSVPVG